MNANTNHVDTYITNYLIRNNLRIIELRKRYEISVDGFDVKQFLKTGTFPNNWSYSGNRRVIEKIEQNIKSILKDSCYPVDIHSSVLLYILFNDLDVVLKNRRADLIKFSDMVERSNIIKDLLNSNPHISAGVLQSSDMQHAKNYPISISFTPDITITNLKSFLDDNWSHIESIRSKYRSSERDSLLNMNARSRGHASNLKRMYIFKNKSKNSKTIKQGLKEFFGITISEEQIRSEKTEILKLLEEKL